MKTSSLKLSLPFWKNQPPSKYFPGGENDCCAFAEILTGDFDPSFCRLGTVEKEYKAVAKTTGGQVDKLAEIVKETGELQEKITKSLNKQVFQEVMKYAMKADKDKNFKYTKNELKMLKMRLVNIQGVDFNSETFDQVVGERELTLTEIMLMLRKSIDGEAGPDNIFKADWDQLKERKIGLFSSPFKN